jgi:hypothetical protein
MRRHRQATCVASVLTVAAAFLALVLGAVGAAAHEHPTQVELDAPAVVHIKTLARVDISLIEHNRLGRHIGLYRRTYEIELAAGSGFAVDPNGTVVTTGGLVNPDLKRAELWAVNKAFSERYPAGAPLPRDPFGRNRIKDLPGDPLNARLQRCYRPNTTDGTGGCLVTTSRVVRVFPWVSSQAKYGQLTADVLTPAPGRTQDVAVLRVGASSMPTVALARSAAGTKSFTVLGFTTLPTTEVKSQLQLIGHFEKAGGGPLDQDENVPKLVQGLSGGAAGGPLVAAQSGQVAGFLTAPAQAGAGPGFVDAERIREVLSGVGVEPQRGPTDSVYEDAMHSFKNKLYTAPIPSFQRTLELYPGHALAGRYLAESRQKQGTSEDLTGRAGAPGSGSEPAGGRSLWLLVIPLLLVLLAVPATIVVLRRRAASPAEDAAPPALPELPPPAGPQAGAAAERPEAPAGRGGPATSTPRAGAMTGWRARVGRATHPPESRSTPPPGRGATPPGQRPAPAEPGGSAGRRWSPSAPLVVGGREAGAAPAAGAGPVPAAAPTPADGDGAPAAVGPPEAEAQPPRSFCTQCGGKLSPDHRFCGHCGSPVE